MNPTTTIETKALADEQATVQPHNLAAMVLDAAERHSGVALQAGELTVSYPELGGIVNEIARGLISLGIDHGDRVAILGSTSPHECGYVLEHSGARLVFCEDAAQAAKVDQIRDRCPDLEHVVLFDGEAEG